MCLREALSDDGQRVNIGVWKGKALKAVVVAFAVVVTAVGIRPGRVAAEYGRAIVFDIQTLP
jgi:hypothetical protein